MTTTLMVIDAIICLALIVSVILQSSKSSGMGGSISGGADAVFGGKAKGIDALLAKTTMVLGALFAIITLIIAKMQA
ncbi:MULTISPECIES: preprotein translocase subunit SecG [Anaerosinus]|uniref:Protein-export membrane protein SecG n=1 Tax=Selenobaculum gibii TaxID=3054208 RepID=A0A9Y2AJ11_9FIRM|nr:preprotein translocase subunit SecG [Selenobaculum gbiensis]WIW70305.1 preprotein translocase subunit SecG [Selenobaculum gbiensis]